MLCCRRLRERLRFGFMRATFTWCWDQSKDGKPIRFTVKLDGTPPGEDHGSDTDANGNGTVQGHRLYQLIRQKGPVEDRTFEIEFLDPGVQAFAFTFG